MPTNKSRGSRALPDSYDEDMGRHFENAAVVKAYDAAGKLIDEDIVPTESYAKSGSLLLNSSEFRAAHGIRFISFRLFDESGNRVERRTMWFDLQGNEVPGLHRSSDGTIIENPWPYL